MAFRRTEPRILLLVLALAGVCAVASLTPLVTAATRRGATGSLGAVPRPAITGPKPTSPAAGGSYGGLRAQGSKIVDADGREVRLLGFNSSGAEYACTEGWGIFDGPNPMAFPVSVVRAMHHWTGTTAVRIPLNEQCWLGLGVSSRYGGTAYRQAVHALVDQLHSHGLVAVLDLHRTAPGRAVPKQQEQMPDRDHSIEFWRQVATEYRDDPTVVFDLFNEPWPYGDVTSDRAWTCWRDGGCRLQSQNGPGQYIAAGMSELLGAVRDAGAHNLVVLGGIHWAEQLDRWLDYVPDDPAHNVAAGFHNYPYNQYCASSACYDTVLAKVAAQVPLVAGEIGGDDVDPDCQHLAKPVPGFADRIFNWLDAHDASYMAWSWNAWGDACSLVTNYSTGTPTPGWGAQVKARLAANATPAGGA